VHKETAAATSNALALIGIGANLAGPGDAAPIDTCRRAAGLLAALGLVGLSRWYVSAPVPPSGQPDYVNGVAALRSSLDPASLLARLMAIEAACGRRRGAPNAARTLDLDIVAIGSLVRDAPDPVLPHPRAHLRAFVLRPLTDVAPGWVHPLLGKTAAALLAGLPPQAIRLL
jgi:2-amino-4-hydroxy-6-hydroxymethyldihydropteridine diphosphokinase